MRYLFYVLFFFSLRVFAQDVIVKKDGSTILAKVEKVGSTTIEYKKWKNLNGPIYTISVNELMSINYQNGEIDTFSQNNDKADNKENSREIVKKPSSQNKQLIDSYRSDIKQKEAPSKSDATYCTLYFGVTSSSIISNEDIDISFTQLESGFRVHSFDIIIKNKTNRVIYIDKGNCFRTINGTSSYCYYNNETTSYDKVDGTGTFSVQRIIAIPAHSTKKLCEDKKIKVGSRTNWWVNVDPNEDFEINTNQKPDGSFSMGFQETPASQFGLNKGSLKIGQVISYSEDTTPYIRNYYLRYSFSEDISSYSAIEFAVYVQHVYGHKMWSSKGQENIEKRTGSSTIKCSYAKLE